MRLLALSFAIAVAFSFPGCGTTSAPVPASSHNGMMIALPQNKGYFEIGTEGGATKDARGSRSKGGADNTIVVYFYQPDGTTEMSPPPTDVMVKVNTVPESPSVALALRPKGGFASAPGAFPSGFRGSLTAKIGGEAIEAPFLIR